jgi:hypothetical protein
MVTLHGNKKQHIQSGSTRDVASLTVTNLTCCHMVTNQWPHVRGSSFVLAHFHFMRDVGFVHIVRRHQATIAGTTRTLHFSSQSVKGRQINSILLCRVKAQNKLLILGFKSKDIHYDLHFHLQVHLRQQHCSVAVPWRLTVLPH